MDLEQLKSIIEDVDQSQVFTFWNELDEAGKAQLSAQLEAINFPVLKDLIADYVLQRPKMGIPADLEPAPFFPLKARNADEEQLYAKAMTVGEDMLRQGRVAALTVAGGQGTRLGFDGPKGTYPIAPLSNKTLFQYFAESIKRYGEKYGKPITWYIMTSIINHEATESFFKANNYFTLDANQVVFFTQGTMPAVGYDGKLLLGSKSSLSLSPDGHGGTLLALRKSGALARMEAEGNDVISYFQVDNPLVPVVDPFFIGMHALQESQISAIMLAKTGPFEKLGNFCTSKGRVEIIEYSDLPVELAESRNEDGSLRFIAGSPAIHVISREFVANLTAGGTLQLPWHRADKKVPYVDSVGNEITPAEPNAVKLESFIFDAMPLATKTMVLEGKREDLFAPTKNKTGVDSAESCRLMLMDRDARWLESAGVAVPRDENGTLLASIEISPLLAVDASDVAEYVAKKGNISITAGDKLYLQG